MSKGLNLRMMPQAEPLGLPVYRNLRETTQYAHRVYALVFRLRQAVGQNLVRISWASGDAKPDPEMALGRGERC